MRIITMAAFVGVLLTVPTISAGQYWAPTNGPVLAGGVGVEALGFNSAGDIFAPTTTGSCFDISALGVFRSSDSGGTWTQINAGLTTTNVRSLTVAPSGVVFAGTRTGVFASTDAGASWTQTSLMGTDISVLLSIGDSVYAGDGCFCTGVYRTRDNGASWVQLNNGLQTCINALAVNASGHLFAGSGVSGVFRSTNDGASWEPANSGMTSGRTRSLAINSQGHLFAGTDFDGLFRSSDNGNTWTPLSVGPPGLVVYRIAISSTDDIYVGTNLFGVFVSHDNGETWSTVNSGLPTNGTVEALAFDNSGTLLAAPGSVVYRLVETPTTLPVAIDIKPESFPNLINPRNGGVIPVAILTTRVSDGDSVDFDAAVVASASIAFGAAGAGPAHAGHFEDVDGDGDPDLLFHFRTRESGIACGDTSANLTGQTLSGQSFEGADSIATVGCN